MFQPFKLKSTLGRSHNVDLDDTLGAKKTFGGLGYDKTPSYGLTKYPDEPLFKGIESFQKDNGLRKDGVMKPGGETQTTLNHVLTRNELAKKHKRSNGAGIDSRQLYGMFDKFTSQPFHASDSAYSTQCCATGTSDCEND